MCPEDPRLPDGEPPEATYKPNQCEQQDAAEEPPPQTASLGPAELPVCTGPTALLVLDFSQLSRRKGHWRIPP